MGLAVLAVLVIGGGIVGLALGLDSHDESGSTSAGPVGNTARSSPMTPGENSAPAAGQPEVGQCRDLTTSDLAAQSDDSAVVPCNGQATAQTVYVGQVDSQNPDTVGKAASRVCYGALEKAMGIRPEQLRSSIASFVFYQPTSQQYAAGARWFRCDAVLLDGDEPITLPQDLGSIYDTDSNLPADRYRACLDGSHQRVLCGTNKGGLYTYDGGVSLHDRTQRPVRRELLLLSRERCSRPKGSILYATWPDAVSWAKDDQRVIACWILFR